jgi:4'-phosphopantetheinyl transferase
VSLNRALSEGEAHIHYVLLDEAKGPDLERAYHALMNEDEARRHARYRFEKNRHEFLLTRALVRTTLSRYADVDPRDWQFASNKHGCPEVAGPAGAPKLEFNLSNTTGLVAIIVARSMHVGVDVEWMDRRTETVGIADRYFSKLEVAALRALPEDRQRYRFFQYWTLKESYIKGRKMGLAIPLQKFSFRLDQGDEIGIDIDPSLGDDASSWHFMQAAPSPAHLLSAAARSREKPTFKLEKIVPAA